jgi:hypothetical protein
MIRIAPTLLALLPLVAMPLAGCVGDTLGGEVEGEGEIVCTDDGVTCRIPADDPSDDDRLDALGIVCESHFRVTGTFQPGIAQPADQNGCWPVGTWTITAELEDQGCDPQPELLETMTYNVNYDDEATQIAVLFPSDPPEICTNGEDCCDDGQDNDGDGLVDNLDPGCRLNLKISSEGDGLCHGSMDHYALDNSVWGFRPTLQEDGSLSGIGTYAVHNSDSF